MKNLAQTIRQLTVQPGSLALIWLAQAGFVFKTPAAKIIYVDPYLTDSVQRLLPEYGLGFKRLTPSLIEPQEVEADYVISTHSHQDHLDVDALPIMARNPRACFIGAPDCRAAYLDAGLPDSRFAILHQDETLDLPGFQLTGVYADHGSLAPDALGLWFNFDGLRVWVVGDTAYRPERWGAQFAQNPDLLIPPINGAFGNLNEVEAARLAGDAHARWTLPCHFWMFPLHQGNPLRFLEACQQHAPETKPLLLTPGEVYYLNG